MSDSKFDLGDYVEVKDRIKLFYELYGQGRLVTERYELTREPDDKPKVIVEAAAYRSPEDVHPGRGLSWMYLPGSTSYTKGSELENTETSAWGRAIGALGILIDRSIASGNEVRNKAGQQEPVRDGLIGTAEKGTAVTSDYALRMTAEGGAFLGFRLKNDERKAGFLVEAHDALAEALAAIGASVIGQRIQVWGHWVEHALKNGGKYNAFYIERIQTPDFTLPAESQPSSREGATGEPADERDVTGAGKTSGAMSGSAGEPAAASEAELDALPLFSDAA